MATLLQPSMEGRMAKQPCSKDARAHIVMGGFRSRAVRRRLREHERAGHFCPGCRLGRGHIVCTMKMPKIAQARQWCSESLHLTPSNGV